MFDYHVHSEFSADCSTSMERTIEKAIDIGLKELCFTDHIDYDYPDSDWVFEFDLKEYDTKIKELQMKYDNRIQIKKGVEIGMQPHLKARYEALMKEETFDFVIASLHAVEGKEMHFGEFFEGKTLDEAYRIYYEELYACIRDFNQFQIIGHLDLVKRYTKERSSNGFHDIAEAIFKRIIPEGKGIELNTSGYKYGMDGGMPSEDLLKLYRDCGGEIITIGSDSHKETELATRFRDSLALIQSIGFRYISTFDKGKPVFHPIDQMI